MGYFGPIGAGAVFYVEHARHLFPHEAEGDEEETTLARAMGPIVYVLAPVRDDAVEMRRLSVRVATPTNAITGDKDTFIAYNRFSRHVDPSALNLPSRRSMDDHSDDEDLGKGQKGGIKFV
ncbi:Na(+) H(+) antiporter [Fusarium mexicanum]|uniref:Na(+) H(+) antiporter n=1 Tax=Fusarium mexicanum TaxID=751941 RepID=A0A8H5N6T5_9HYPO|nr:Na(+) H(+) antiporter [Fusarium mexicanum]